MLFLGYLGNNILFTHTHVVNGVSIIHSHPYNSSGENKTPSHSHSSGEYLVLHVLSDFLSLSALLLVSLAIFRFVFAIKRTQNYIRHTFSNWSYNFLLRAPPLKYS